MTPSSPEATPFIGRHQELSDLRQALTSGRLVTLVGAGGAGKTRLARQATRAAREFDQGTVWTVELAEVTDPRLVPLTVIESIGLQDVTTSTATLALADFVGDREVLLVLDNCEHLLAACRDLVTELLPRCAGLRVLGTSRQALGVGGEVVVTVPPLSVPDPEAGLDAEELCRYDAVQLFVERARSALPGFALVPANADAVARLSHDLDGLPLALELAAARIRVLTPEAMVERLRDRYRLLTRSRADVHDRQRSLAASVEWSHDLCSVQERLLWARLSVFSGGFGLEAAERVCSDAQLEPTEVLDVLSDLIDKSLVTRDPGDALHYRMLESIRQYGAARLEESGGTEQLRARHRQWFLDAALSLGVGWTGPDQARGVDHWRRNHANLRLVLERTARSADRAVEAMVLVMALEGYWLVTGRLTEARHWLETALAHAGDQGDEGGEGGEEDGTAVRVVRAGAHSMCAWIGSIQSDAAYADRELERAGRLLESTRDDLALGYLAFARANVHLFRGDMAAALAETSASIDLFRRADHVNHLVVALAIVGLCHSELGDAPAAAAARAECLALTEPVGELYTRSLVLWSLGLAARDRGELDEATALEARALRMKAALRDRPGIAVVLEAFATLASAADQAHRSAVLLGAAGALWDYVRLHPIAAPFISSERRRGEAIAREALSPEAFEAAFAHGRGLGVDGAVAYALGEDESGPRARARGPVLGTDTGSGAALTGRESEVALLVGRGLTNQDIADQLVISIRTAQGHVEQILRKLGFGSRTQVAAWVASGGTESLVTSPARVHRDARVAR